MGRLEIDGARDRTEASRLPHRESVAPRREPVEIQQLDDAPPRPIDRERATEPLLTLPSGEARELVEYDGRTYRLRGSEVDLLESVARFRAVFAEDLAHAFPSERQLHGDLHGLERQGLIEQRSVSQLRTGRTANVVTATSRGQALLEAHRDPARDRGQVYYSGWVKPREVWHDAQLFRMVHQVCAEVEREGGAVRRVILDDELKGRTYRLLHEHQQRSESPADAHTQVAAICGLAQDEGRFVFPDVRLEIEEADGRVRTMDLELVTEHYHRGHLAGKCGAGLRMFRGGGPSGGRGTPQDERLMRKVLR